MKFKEIKPGMVIHCPKEEDARALLEHLGRNGYYWVNGARLNDAIETGYVSNVYKTGNAYTICLRLNCEGNDVCRCYTVKLTTKAAEDEITEFSDLIEPEPKFKVGDKVRVKNNLHVGTMYGAMPLVEAMTQDIGKVLTILSINETCDGFIYATYESAYGWTDEMLEPVNDFNAPNASSNALNDKSNAPMSAVEVLEWLSEHYSSSNDMRDAFGGEYFLSFDRLLHAKSPQEIVDKITAYEAAKKAPKPVELEWVNVVRIAEMRDSGDAWYVYEEELPSGGAKKIPTEKILQEYAADHDGKYYAVVERRCQAKGE